MLHSEFKFELLSVRNETKASKISRLNEIYLFWKSFWPAVLDELEAPHPHWADEFYKYSHASVLLYRDIPVSLHLYMVLHLKSSPCLGTSYFDPFESSPDRPVEKLLEDGHHRLLTASWLTVNNDFARNPDRIAFSRCQMALSLRVGQLLGCDALIGPTRVNNGIAERIMEWGAKSYGRSRAHNTPVELLLMRHDLKVPLRNKEQEIINAVWTPEDSEIQSAA